MRSGQGGAELVAVICWGGAAKRLKERDHHIGWDTVTCANRIDPVEHARALNAGFHHNRARPYAGLRLLKTSPPKIY